MDLQSVQNASNMHSLPDEIIVMILQTCTPRDILNFSATCKQYYEVVKNHNALWKNKCSTTFSPILYKVMEEFCNGSWLGEMKYYYELKQKIHLEVIAMAPKYYWVAESSLEYVNLTSLHTPKKFFYVIHILQDLIETGSKLIDKNKCIRPYTLTDMYYSKMVLRYLMHSYLAVKWTKAKVQHDLPPEVVANIFLQWIDPSKLYLDETAEKQINVLVKEVKETLEDVKKSHGHCNGMEIINAVSHVIYKKRRTVITAASDLNTLDICKVIDNKCGNVVIVATLYQAVAARCGAPCELIVFPNHLFLEWNDNDSPQNQQYNIDLASGKLYQKRQCPYASTNRNPRPKYLYSPDALLQFMISSFVITMGALRTWNSQNALHLLGFLSDDIEHGPFPYKYNPYKNYYIYLVKNVNTLIHSGKPDLTKLTNEHIQIIDSLLNLNMIDEVPIKPKKAKKHTGCVKFAVGMICYHKRYGYICIVRDWELTGSQIHFPLDDLHFGRNQPVYYITAADQSERYVAQENLMEVTSPTRLYYLEYQISRDFTHFDGFAYVLNDQKRAEYPEDEHIVEVFRALCRDKPNNI